MVSKYSRQASVVMEEEEAAMAFFKLSVCPSHSHEFQTRSQLNALAFTSLRAGIEYYIEFSRYGYE